MSKPFVFILSLLLLLMVAYQILQNSDDIALLHPAYKIPLEAPTTYQFDVSGYGDPEQTITVMVSAGPVKDIGTMGDGGGQLPDNFEESRKGHPMLYANAGKCQVKFSVGNARDYRLLQQTAEQIQSRTGEQPWGNKATHTIDGVTITEQYRYKNTRFIRTLPDGTPIFVSYNAVNASWKKDFDPCSEKAQTKAKQLSMQLLASIKIQSITQ